MSWVVLSMLRQAQHKYDHKKRDLPVYRQAGSRTRTTKVFECPSADGCIEKTENKGERIDRKKIIENDLTWR
ncbi:MAG: hypothetical protein K8F36_03815 [Melioribacteraceae bacterium]|nr:hypothetical protein [Melioribacteraceae bacterium]